MFFSCHIIKKQSLSDLTFSCANIASDGCYGDVLQPGSPFREPLGKFLVRYPVQTVEFMLSDTNIRDMQYLRYFVVSQLNIQLFPWPLMRSGITVPEFPNRVLTGLNL